MGKLEFPSGFVWGTATAAYQVEGAAHEGGRSESIWDVFCRKPGKVYAGESGEVACDHYHRYEKDIALMAEIGFTAYRFSLAWPRIIPGGRGAVNPEALAFYRSLIAEMHSHGISACATIYHWDLPQVLQEKGGWTARETAFAFEEYARVCFREFGGIVDQWITINEPYCVAWLGYDQGVHAPGIEDLDQALRAIHHLNLAHGLAVRVYRGTGLKAPIGITWNPSTPRPATNSQADKKAALTARAVETEVFSGPVLGKGYPDIVTGELGLSFPVEPGDMEIIAEKIDFIGVNYYTESPVGRDDEARFKYSGKPAWQERSLMGWPVTPAGFDRLLRWIAREVREANPAAPLPIYITENGFAWPDRPEWGGVHDQERIGYFRSHLEVISRLIREGFDIRGYFAWSFMDNFEWAFGYTRRFGLVYTDYTNLERIPKDSAWFFRDLVAGYGE